MLDAVLADVEFIGDLDQPPLLDVLEHEAATFQFAQLTQRQLQAGAELLALALIDRRGVGDALEIFALAKLERAAAKAGIDQAQARHEGRQLAAAIAESNRGAFVDWCAAVGVAPAASAFFEAAVTGRRYRSSAPPTASLASTIGTRAAVAYRQALVEVCTAAALLGEPGPQSLGAAQLAAAAQLGAAASQRPSPGLAVGPAAMDETQRDFERHAPSILNDVLHRLSESSQRLLLSLIHI